MPMDTQLQPRPSVRRRLRLPIAVLTAAAAALVLVACGGGSSSSGTSTTSASATKPNGSRSGGFAALRTCLQKEGINLPSAPSGGNGSGGPPNGGAGGFKLPEEVSRSKFQEAIKKCGGGGFPGGRRPGFDSATARAALTKYATCMRESGVNLPAPNTGGKGPIFDTKGIDTSSATFKNAQKKCQSVLKGAFGAGGAGAGGGPPPGGGEGAPPAGGYGPPPGAEESGA